MPASSDSFLLGKGQSEYLEEVRQIVVWGSEKEIGSQLAKIGRDKYCVRFAAYEDRYYAEARRRFYQRNWPTMWERITGVAEEIGRDKNLRESLVDFSALVYDMSPSSRRGSLECSAVFFPRTQAGGPLVARNFDAWQRSPAEVFDENENCAFSRHLYSRPFVMEISPVGGHRRRLIAVGGHDLLFPFQDALNDNGLFVTTLADRAPPLTQHMAMAGGRNTGLSSRQLLMLVASNCDDVADAKTEVLAHQPRMDFGLHWLIADAAGNATVLSIDEHGCFIFSDAKDMVGERPFPVTNHPLYTSGWKTAYKSYRPAEDYDTFNRYRRLSEAIEGPPRDYTRQEAEQIMDRVACAYADPKVAGSEPMRTFTAWSLTADLSQKTLQIRFNCGLRGRDPERDNHLLIKWKACSVGFAPNPSGAPAAAPAPAENAAKPEA